MNKKTLRALKKYLTFTPASGCVIWASGVVWIGFVAGLISGISSEDGMQIFAGAAGTLMFGVLLFLSTVKPRIDIAKEINERIRSIPAEELIRDFEEAVPLGKDNIVRVGEKYIYGKHSGQPVRYEDIRSLQIIRTSGKGFSFVRLVGTLRNGLPVVICIRHNRRKPPQSMLEAVAFIIKKNPGITLQE